MNDLSAAAQRPKPKYLIVGYAEHADLLAQYPTLLGPARKSVDGTQCLLRLDADDDGNFPDGAVDLSNLAATLASADWTAPDAQ